MTQLAKQKCMHDTLQFPVLPTLSAWYLGICDMCGSSLPSMLGMKLLRVLCQQHKLHTVQHALPHPWPSCSMLTAAWRHAACVFGVWLSTTNCRDALAVSWHPHEDLRSWEALNSRGCIHTGHATTWLGSAACCGTTSGTLAPCRLSHALVPAVLTSIYAAAVHGCAASP
jgi:hypothetical protein